MGERDSQLLGAECYTDTHFHPFYIKIMTFCEAKVYSSKLDAEV